MEDYDTQLLTDYLHDHIPISRAMGVEVLHWNGGGLSIASPLGPNINHRNSAFGGSISSLLLFTAWSQVWAMVGSWGVSGTIVVKESTTRFLKPVTEAYMATISAPTAQEQEKLLAMYERFGRCRIHLGPQLFHRSGVTEVLAEMDGEFVVLSQEG